MLQRSKIKPNTQRSYLEALEQFLARYKLARMPAWTHDQWGLALLEHLECLFDSGHDLSKASRTASSVMWLNPTMVPPLRTSLPLTAAALRGWKRQEPGITRPPLPRVLMLAIARALCLADRRPSALLVILLFDSYMRVSEALIMRPEQVLAPVQAGGGIIKHVSILITASEFAQQGKTEVRDLSVALDAPWQQPAALQLLQYAMMRKGQSSLFPLEYRQFSSHFRQAVETVGLQILKPVVHSLRHGGATRDRSVNFRSLSSIQQRGAGSQRTA